MAIGDYTPFNTGANPMDAIKTLLGPDYMKVLNQEAARSRAPGFGAVPNPRVGIGGISGGPIAGQAGLPSQLALPAGPQKFPMGMRGVGPAPTPTPMPGAPSAIPMGPAPGTALQPVQPMPQYAPPQTPPNMGGLPQAMGEIGPAPVGNNMGGSPMYNAPPANVQQANIGMQSRFGVNEVPGMGSPIAQGSGGGAIPGASIPSTPSAPITGSYSGQVPGAGAAAELGGATAAAAAPTSFANAAEAMAAREAGGLLGVGGSNASMSMYGANRAMGAGKLQSFLPDAKLAAQLEGNLAKLYPQAAGSYTPEMISGAAKAIGPKAMIMPALGAAGYAYAGHSMAPSVASLIADESEKDTPKGLLADVAGGATRGAGVGAGVGLLGGPFAGISVPGGALAGLVGGGIAGAVTHAMGNSEIEDGEAAAQDNRSVGEKLNGMLDQSGFQSGTPERQRMAETMNALIQADQTPAGQEAALKAGQQMIMEGIGQRQQQEVALEQQLAYQSMAQQIMGPMMDQQQASTDMYRSAMESVIPSLPANFQPIAKYAMENNSAAASKTAQAYLTQAMAAPQLQEMLNAQELQGKIDSRSQSQAITEMLKQQESQGAAGLGSTLTGQALGG